MESFDISRVLAGEKYRKYDISKLFDLKGKVAIVTGGFGDIGRAIIRGLRHYGADVVIVDVVSPSMRDDFLKDFQKRGKCLAIQADITRPRDIRKAVTMTLERFGKIDILVNNAGILRRSAAEKMSKKDWDDVIKVNLTALFLCSQAVGNVMIKQGHGKIVNVASTDAERGVAGLPSYCSSKGGVVALTRSLAMEWAKYNISVNAISPYFVATKMVIDRLSQPGVYDRSVSMIAMGRLLIPEDLVGAVIFLSSDASRMVTGHVLHVDGGYMAGIS